MRYFTYGILYIILIVLLYTPGWAGQVFTWTPPTLNMDGSGLTDLGYYNIYLLKIKNPNGSIPSQGVETFKIDAFKPDGTPNIEWEMPDVDDGEYDLHVTAEDIWGNESGQSNALLHETITIPEPPTNFMKKIIEAILRWFGLG